MGSVSQASEAHMVTLTRRTRHDHRRTLSVSGDHRSRLSGPRADSGTLGPWSSHKSRNPEIEKKYHREEFFFLYFYLLEPVWIRKGKFGKHPLPLDKIPRGPKNLNLLILVRCVG